MTLFSTKTRKAANCATKSAAYAAQYAGDDLRHAHEDAVGTVRDFQRNLSIAAEKTGRRTRRMVDNVYGEIENTTEHLTSQIRENPVKALALLLAAGFMLGSLFTKRR